MDDDDGDDDDDDDDDGHLMIIIAIQSILIDDDLSIISLQSDHLRSIGSQISDQAVNVFHVLL